MTWDDVLGPGQGPTRTVAPAPTANQPPQADPWHSVLGPAASSPTPAAQVPPAAVSASSDEIAQPGPPTLGQMSVLEKPADVSYNDFVRAHLAEWAKGGRQIGQTADDYVRSATNAFGVGDRIAAYLSGLTGVGGGDLAAQRAQSAAANERLGPVAYAANMTGYGPVSALRIAPRAADAARALTGGSRLAGWGAGAAASGAQGRLRLGSAHSAMAARSRMRRPPQSGAPCSGRGLALLELARPGRRLARRRSPPRTLRLPATWPMRR